MHVNSSIRLKKETFKFSSAHITVFPDGSKERLHGHNYRVEVVLDLKTIAFDALLPFSAFKKLIQEICYEWDEKILLPSKCPFLTIIPSKIEEIEIILCKKRYIFPSEDVAWLDTDNITVENLSYQFCLILVKKIEQREIQNILNHISVTVEESLGQEAVAAYTFHEMKL